MATDHYPNQSTKELRLVLDDLKEAEAHSRVRLKEMEATLEAAAEQIKKIEETFVARKQARQQAESAAQREAQERGDT